MNTYWFNSFFLLFQEKKQHASQGYQSAQVLTTSCLKYFTVHILESHYNVVPKHYIWLIWLYIANLFTQVLKLAKLFFLVIMSTRMQQSRHLPPHRGDVNWCHPSGKQFSNVHEEPWKCSCLWPSKSAPPRHLSYRSSGDGAGLTSKGD